nr:TIR domain-containing protein [uncultured Methanospirillum sp.]
MAKRVYFSFHYDGVIDFRVNVVRNHNALKKDNGGYFDSSIWEEAKTKGDSAIKELINESLKNTTVTVVLIGSETYERRWVRYEIMQSMKKGNKILGIHINKIKDKEGKTKTLGNNPFVFLGYKYDETGKTLIPYQYIEDEWKIYSDLDRWNIKGVEEKKCNSFNTLKSDYIVYDWEDNDGYNNFSSWIL